MPYYRYFGEQAGAASQGYYAVQIGAWRVIGLNSNIDVEAGSMQERWLKRELAEHTPRCTLAWHHPRFSSGQHGDASLLFFMLSRKFESRSSITSIRLWVFDPFSASFKSAVKGSYGIVFGV